MCKKHIIMERVIWLLTFIPCRVLLVLLGVVDYYLFVELHSEGLLQDTIFLNTTFLAVVATVVIVASILCIIIGGKIGHEYVEMGRSRRWHYRANKFDDFNSQLRNAIYWSIKFACFPIILTLVLFLVGGLTYIL